MSWRMNSNRGLPSRCAMLRLRAGEEIVDAQDLVALGDQALAEIRADEAGAACHHDSTVEGHVINSPELTVRPPFVTDSCESRDASRRLRREPSMHKRLAFNDFRILWRRNGFVAAPPSAAAMSAPVHKRLSARIGRARCARASLPCRDRCSRRPRGSPSSRDRTRYRPQGMRRDLSDPAAASGPGGSRRHCAVRSSSRSTSFACRTATRLARAA